MSERKHKKLKWARWVCDNVETVSSDNLRIDVPTRPRGCFEEFGFPPGTKKGTDGIAVRKKLLNRLLDQPLLDLGPARVVVHNSVQLGDPQHVLVRKPRLIIYF